MAEKSGYVWRVESSEELAGRTRVALVRSCERRTSSLFREHVEVLERVVFFSRSFRSLLDAVAETDYRAQLELIANHCRHGQFGCFVVTQSEGSRVEAILYERTFDGVEVRTTELARRGFDASDERSLVASAEFVADVQMWAERRNEARVAAIRDERERDAAQMELASEQAAAGRELTEILAAHAHVQ